MFTIQNANYDYLGDLIEDFPGGSATLGLIDASGFDNASAERLTGGIVAIYPAVKRS